MTAQLESRVGSAGSPKRRRKKALAFGLAAAVVVSGIAGVVVTSSAYFTDVKEIGTNTVTLSGIDIDAFEDNGSILASFSLDDLAPSNPDVSGQWASSSSPTRAFKVANIGRSALKYTVSVTNIEYTTKDGLPLDATNRQNNGLAIAEISPVVKVSAVRAPKGGTPAYDAATSVSLQSLGTTPQILADATLTKEDSAVDTDEAVVGVRFWIDQRDINGWTPADQNLLQNLKITYTIKLSAIQVNS